MGAVKATDTVGFGCITIVAYYPMNPNNYYYISNTWYPLLCSYCHTWFILKMKLFPGSLYDEIFSPRVDNSSRKRHEGEMMSHRDIQAFAHWVTFLIKQYTLCITLSSSFSKIADTSFWKATHKISTPTSLRSDRANKCQDGSAGWIKASAQRYTPTSSSPSGVVTRPPSWL